MVNHVNPDTGDGATTTLYIINLISSTMPMALEVPDVPELEGFAVFRSRHVEDGRDRFRLHVGYFESPEDAKRVLRSVRGRYPAAWISLAPHDSMGSLDDTSVAQFKFIRQTRTAAPARPRVPESKPAAPVAMTATLVSAGSHNHPMQARRPMTPAQVLQLLESAPRAAAHRAAAVRAPGQEPAPAVLINAQKFAVQLVWSTKPVQASVVPQLAIFEAYSLYTVQVERAGRRWYGLRLGFFKDPLSARQVALYARSDFAAAAVVPVSDRECGKAAAAAAVAQSVLGAPVVPKSRTSGSDEIILNEDKPARAAVSRPVASVAAAAPVTAPRGKAPEALRPRDPDPAQAKQRPQAKRRLAKTADELLEELGANELGIDTNTSCDELNDSGVRHLSVAVVSRQSALSRLLDRVARKRHH